jgi:glycosyltransferase involved in cell wall biosynthesis
MPRSHNGSPPPARIIGFDATPFEVRQRSGVSRYASELLQALLAREGNAGKPYRYTLLTSRTLNGNAPPGAFEQSQWHFPNRSVWMQAVLPMELRRMQPALCHFTNMIAPLAAPCPFVLTLHDLSLLLHAETQPTKSLMAVRPIMARAAHKAAAIIAVSHAIKQEIVAELGVPAHRVRVIYEAASPAYHPIHNNEKLDAVRQRYGLHAPFVLFVGTIEPRKNLPVLLQAFAQLRRMGHAEQLVLAGGLGWKYQATLQHIESLGLRDCVRQIGYVPDADLPAIYNLARALAFVSRYEGFGLPILESMACGTPVITSNGSAMAELGESAALLVDPNKPEAIAHALHRVLSDEVLHDALRCAGLVRAAQFSWAKAAAETAALYEECLDPKPRAS